MKYLFQSFRLLALIFLAGGFMAACNGDNADNAMDNDSDSAMSDMDQSGADMQQDVRQKAIVNIDATYEDTAVDGKAVFTTLDNGHVKLELTLHIPSKANQTVAVHLHENGACGDHGKAAGGHWNPTSDPHGKWGVDGYHMGDIGNVELDGEGDATFTMETEHWTIGGDSATNILGKTLIVHGGADDFTSQPSGAAGARIGCGIIQ